jgi:beta-N-acetylhexosaminidase
LRRRIGFTGVSITDALETPSVDHFGGPVPVGVDAAKAGTDLLLYTDDGDAAKAGQALQKQLKTGKLKRAPAERSVNRVLRLRAKSG